MPRNAIAGTAALLCLVVGASANTIIVDCEGGGDYLTIQEGVDAAAEGDTVLVRPCIYTDMHPESEYSNYLMNVYIHENIALISTDGAASTIIDGGGSAEYGIVARATGDFDPKPLVQGFTVRNGSTADPRSGIHVIGADAKDNIVDGYRYGIYVYGSGEPVVSGNVVTDADYGIRSYGRVIIAENTVSESGEGVRVGVGGPTAVEANTIAGNGVGISVRASSATSEVTLLGNVVSGNSQGVYLTGSGDTHYTVTLYASMEGNQVFGNVEENIRVAAAVDASPGNIYLSMGGSLVAANDVHASPVNIHASQVGSAEAVIDAPYNYWGSTLCCEFVPLFLLDGVPEGNLTYLPFTDETHTQVFEACENNPVESTTWGRIKAMYQ